MCNSVEGSHFITDFGDLPPVSRAIEVAFHYLLEQEDSSITKTTMEADTLLQTLAIDQGLFAVHLCLGKASV